MTSKNVSACRATSDTIVESAEHLRSPSSIHLNKEIFDLASSHWHKPFAEQHIRMLQLGSWMTTCDQDEEDKSLIAKLFSESWQTLHVQVGNRKLIPNNEDTLHVVATYQALGRLQLAHLLTEGLPQHAIEWLNEACLSTKER